MGEKQPRSDRWRRFWHWHGFEIVIILALAVGYAVFSFVPADVLFGHGSSSSAVSSSSTTPFHDGAVIGSSDGIDIGRSDGFDAGVSAGESFSSPSSLDGPDHSSDSSAGYDFGYGRFYPRGWLSGYIDGYISQHPEINEYDLLDDILYTFPDVDTDDLIDYLRSAR